MNPLSNVVRSRYSARTRSWTRISTAAVVAAIVVLVSASTAAATPPPRGDGATPRTEAPLFVLDGEEFEVFDAPDLGSNHFPRINNRGEIVGEYFKDDGTIGGYMRDRRGRFTEIVHPDASETIPLDINDRRVIVGNYRVGPEGASRGFMRDARGRFTTLQVPGSTATQAFGVNNRGHIVGDYTKADGSIHGYRWHNGRFTTIDGPEGTGATLTDVNDREQIIGVYAPTQGRALAGFMLSKGRYTTIETDANFTIPTGINNRGHITGSTFDAVGGMTTEAHGFVLRDGADGPLTPVDYPGAIVGTNATGINDRGQIVGRYGNPDYQAAVTIDEAPAMQLHGKSLAGDR